MKPALVFFGEATVRSNFMRLRDWYSWPALVGCLALFGGVAAARQVVRGNGADEFVFALPALLLILVGLAVLVAARPDADRFIFPFSAGMATYAGLDHVQGGWNPWNRWWAASWAVGLTVFVLRKAVRRPRQHTSQGQGYHSPEATSGRQDQ